MISCALAMWLHVKCAESWTTREIPLSPPSQVLGTRTRYISWRPLIVMQCKCLPQSCDAQRRSSSSSFPSECGKIYVRSTLASLERGRRSFFVLGAVHSNSLILGSGGVVHHDIS